MRGRITNCHVGLTYPRSSNTGHLNNLKNDKGRKYVGGNERIEQTRGQWPFRPVATRAMRNRHVMLHKSDMNLMSLKT